MVVNNKRDQYADSAVGENKPLNDIKLIECNFANRFIERFCPLVISIFNGYTNDGKKRPISELPLTNKLALAANFPKYTSEKIIHENIKTSKSHQFHIKNIKEWVSLMTNYISPALAIGITNPKEFEKLMNDFFNFFDQESNKDIYAGIKPKGKITALRKSVVDFFQAVKSFLCLHWQDTKYGSNLDIEKYHELKNIKIPLKEKLNLEKDFKSFASSDDVSSKKVTYEAGNIKQKKILAKLIRKLEKYLGSRRPKSVFFKGELSSMANFTWEKINISVDEIIQILKDEIVCKATRHNDLRDVGKLYALLSFAEYESSLGEVKIELKKKVQHNFDANSLDKEKINQTKWVFELIAGKILERNKNI
jgi:hypothetical protein